MFVNIPLVGVAPGNVIGLADCQQKMWGVVGGGRKKGVRKGNH